MPVSLAGPFGNLLGPYEKWMFDIGKRFDLPALMLDKGESMSCVAEFAFPANYAGFDLASKNLQGAADCYWIILPTLYKNDAFTTRFLPFVVDPAKVGMPNAPLTTLLDQTSEYVRVFNASLVDVAQQAQPITGSFRINFPIRTECMGKHQLSEAQTEPVKDPALNGAMPKVILAAIDLGIPFAHANFRHPGTAKTRMDFCWFQSALAPTDPNRAGEVLFGQEVRRDQIDRMVQDAKGDEDEVYRRAGVLSQPNGPPMPLSRASSHGAHIMDLMAGEWPAATAAQVRLIAVDLPSSSVWETSGFGKDMFVLSALHYIFDRADRIRDEYGCDDLPLVINLSYGSSGGPHDGSSLIEAALEEMISFRNTLAPTTLVMPSGNTFQDRLFAQINDAHFAAGPAGKTASLQWFAPPNDRTSSFLEIWYPPGTSPGDIPLSVLPPGEDQPVALQRTAAEGDGNVAYRIVVDGKTVGQLSSDLHRGSRWRAMVILAPSDTLPKTEEGVLYGAAPAGLWTLTFHLPPGNTLAGGIDCRIQRDTSFGQGNTGAQQGYFVDPLDPPFADDGSWNADDTVQAKVRRFGSMNGMATGASTLVVGGTVRSSKDAAAYSAAGMDDANKAVRLSAPTERSMTQRGVLAAGTRSGTRFALSGTSSAAPQIARALAEAYLSVADSNTLADPIAAIATQPDVEAVPVSTSGKRGKLRLGAYRLTTARRNG